MISITDLQLNAWIAGFMFPLSRILGVLATAPFFNNAAMPKRNRLMLGIVIAAAIAPTLPTLSNIEPASWAGLAIVVNELLIGLAIGFCMRLVFAAVDMAGELIGLQMGLSFAVFYDPQNGTQMPVVAEFLGIVTLMIFVSLNGHLAMLAITSESFQVIPIGGQFAGGMGAASLLIVRFAATVFSLGVMLALPMIATLLITNIALGILTRAAPQLNLFAVGFPVTMMVGFSMLALVMPYLGAAIPGVFEQGFSALNMLLGGRP